MRTTGGHRVDVMEVADAYRRETAFAGLAVAVSRCRRRPDHLRE